VNFVPSGSVPEASDCSLGFLISLRHLPSASKFSSGSQAVHLGVTTCAERGSFGAAQDEPGRCRARASPFSEARNVGGGDQEAKAAIDASGTLPDGTKFTGPQEFRKALLGRKVDFATKSHREVGNLRARARARVVRHAGGAEDYAVRSTNRLSVVGDHPRDREEHAISESNDRDGREAGSGGCGSHACVVK